MTVGSNAWQGGPHRATTDGTVKRSPKGLRPGQEHAFG